MILSHLLCSVLGAFAIFGVITSTVYSCIVFMAARRFRKRAAGEQTPVFQPPVSVLKPLHGDEPDLEQNLTSFFEQDYPEYEILFCARRVNDAGLEVARKVAARFPHIPSRILTCGEPPWPNARTYSLEIMRQQASYPILATSDSDVRVDRKYLSAVVQPLADEQVGMVTCIYRGVTRLGIWAQFEAMAMSVEMTSGVLVAEMLEGMQFALGPTMVMRQSSVEKIGGYAKVAEYYADDFVMGNWIARAGEKVILSSYIIEHHVMNASFKSSIAHQQAWATSTRYSRPMGHLGELLTYAVPFGLLGLIVLGAAHHLGLGLALLVITIIDRVLLCLVIAGGVVNDKAAVSKVWLYPLRDLMGFCFWVRSYVGSRRLRYRGDPYELLPQGRLRKLAQPQKVSSAH
jgi:ceramide glucosyltransferase